MLFAIVWISELSNFCSSSMFAMGMKRVVNMFISGISAVIIRGPPSFGLFSSIKAGKNMIRISASVVIVIMIIAVRFGIIYNLLSNIA
jgi:hypothetical protein